MAKVTGSGNTSQNMFQRAQELLRQKLYGTSKVTGSPSVSSTNQTTTDAKSGGKALRAYEQTRSSKTKGTPKINQNVKKGAGVAAGLLGSAGGIAATLATTLTSGEDQTTKWKRLGYPSKEHYAAVVAGTMTPQQVKDGKPVPGKDTTPDKRTGSVDTPTEYPTEAVLETIKPSRDYEKEANESSGSDDSGEERTSPEGVVQYGQTLGGLNTFNKGFLGEGYDLTDIKTTYQSVALPATLAGVTQLEKPLVEGAGPTQKPDVSSPFQDNPQTQASFPEGTKPFASTDSYTPYSTGGNPENAQDGASPKPDRVERLRQVAFNGADFSGAEPDDSTLVSPMYANKKRNAIRDAFLDPSMSSVKASVAANALAGYGKDSNGRARFNVGGELVYAKEGMQQQAKNAASMGVDPTEFLDIPSVTPKKDAPSTLDLSKVDVTSSAFTTAEPDAQEFFKKELNKIKTAK